MLETEAGDAWISRVMRRTVEKAAKVSTTAQTGHCTVCLEEDVTDPCETRPCGHHEGCWDCVRICASRIRHCTLCRAEIDCVIRESTGERFDPAAEDCADPGQGNVQSSASTLESVYLTGYWEPTPLHARSHGSSVLDGLDRAVERRRNVYFHHRYSKHVGSNRYSKYREITPQMFLRDPTLVSRARMWIRRELLVFSFLQPEQPNPTATRGDLSKRRQRIDPSRRRAQNAEFLLEYIIAILKTMDIQGSAGEAENMISEYLGRQDTQLFLHELRAWLRSPYTRLEQWDEAVQYDGEIRPGWLARRPLGAQVDEDGDPVPGSQLLDDNTRLRRERGLDTNDRHRPRSWRQPRRSQARH